VGSDAGPDLSPAVRQKLGSAVDEVFGASPELHADLPLGSFEGWDSMNAVTFTMELERVFEVDLGGVILTADQTLGEVVDLLRQKGVQA
jgi:acyl carrier protein